MAKEMNMDTLVKKLKSVSNTQDSIPMLSLWIIHHKAHHKQIVETWLNMLKKSKHQHRLTLLYLCNDVVQNCSRKNAPIYKDSFSDVLAEAVTHLRDSSIKSNVQRVVKIWVKRSVFDTDFTDQLLASLITNTAPEKLRNKLLVEYKTSNLIEEIKQFKVIEDEIESDQIRLKAIRMDVSNMDAIRKLKDKIGGEKFSREFEESAMQLEQFLKRYESYIEGRKSLLDLLDHGTVYYHAQYHEAKIVVNAYKSFENRVKKMKRGVDKVKERFPPLKDSELDKNRGEDMEMSDEDKNLDKKSNIISSIEPKHRKTLKLGDKPIAIPPLPREDGNAAASVIKLFATGLENMKNSNESAADSLKRAMSGLVKRPGMRGATFSASNDTTVSEAATKETFTIVRSVSETTVENAARSVTKDPSPPTGVESPPSPTGSPELNISSPPRMQSLDSRLADLFNEDGTATEIKSQTEVSESDSDSDTDLIKRANRLLDMKQTNLLPGLGDLDKVAEPAQQEQMTLAAPIKTESVEKAEDGKINSSIFSVTAKSSSGATEVTFTPVVNQAIPVIGGISRVAAPINDGSSTPTLDEKPYSPPGASKAYISSTSRGATVPVTYGRDALSFLSKIMGNPTKPDLRSTESTSVPTPTAVTQQSPITANTIYANWPTPPPTWPPTNTHTNTTIASNLWSSPPPVPTLPPPPVFSWSSNHDQTIPPLPWQNLSSSAPRPAQTPATKTLPANTVAPIAAVATVNSTGANVPAPQSLNSKSTVLRSSFSDASIGAAPPPAKKNKWDVKDTDYRSSGQEVTSIEKSIVERRTNLITVSSTGPAALSSTTPLPQASSEGNSMKRNSQYLRSISTSQTQFSQPNNIEDSKTSMDDVVAQNLVAKQPLSHPPNLTSPTGPKRYDALGNRTSSFSVESRTNLPEQLAPITPPPTQFDTHATSAGHHHYDAQGHEIISPEATINQRIKEARLNASANHPISCVKLENPSKPFSEAAHTQPRFEKSLERFADVPRTRPGFENTSEMYHDGQHPRTPFEKPRELFSEIAHPRPGPGRPQEPFSDVPGHKRPDFKMKNPREPFHEMRHPFRVRSPPPLNFRLPGPRQPPPVRRRSTNEMIDARLAMMRDEQRREEALLRDVAMLDEIDRMARPRPWSGRPHPPHLRPHAPRGIPFRGMRPRMRF